MSRVESMRSHWPALVRTLETLLAEARNGSMIGLSIHGSEGGELRTSYVLRDERRDVDVPGVRVEQDETDFDVSDTDVDE